MPKSKKSDTKPATKVSNNISNHHNKKVSYKSNNRSIPSAKKSIAKQKCENISDDFDYNSSKNSDSNQNQFHNPYLQSRGNIDNPRTFELIQKIANSVMQGSNDYNRCRLEFTPEPLNCDNKHLDDMNILSDALEKLRDLSYHNLKHHAEKLKYIIDEYGSFNINENSQKLPTMIMGNKIFDDHSKGLLEKCGENFKEYLEEMIKDRSTKFRGFNRYIFDKENDIQ